MRLLVSNEWLRRKIAADPDCDAEAGASLTDLEGPIMSWFVHAAGNAERVVDRLTKEAAQSHHTEQSRKIVLGIRDIVETLAAADATRTLYVATEGHVDTAGGRFTVSAEVIAP